MTQLIKFCLWICKKLLFWKISLILTLICLQSFSLFNPSSVASLSRASPTNFGLKIWSFNPSNIFTWSVKVSNCLRLNLTFLSFFYSKDKINVKMLSKSGLVSTIFQSVSFWDCWVSGLRLLPQPMNNSRSHRHLSTPVWFCRASNFPVDLNRISAEYYTSRSY